MENSKIFVEDRMVFSRAVTCQVFSYHGVRTIALGMTGPAGILCKRPVGWLSPTITTMVKKKVILTGENEQFTRCPR